MILDNDEMDSRLESSNNLLNRLRGFDKSHNPKEPLAVFKVPAVTHDSKPVFMPPSIDELVSDADDQIKLSGLSTKAMDVLETSLDNLKLRLPEVAKAEKYSTIAADMNRILHSIAEAKENRKGNQTNNIQVIVYAPQVIGEEYFETVSVRE